MKTKIENLIIVLNEAERNIREAKNKQGKNKFLKGLFQGKAEAFSFCASELYAIINTPPAEAKKMPDHWQRFVDKNPD